MIIASAAYPLSRFGGWADYEAKLTSWVHSAHEKGAQVLVFPEYGAMELASLDAGAESALEPAMRTVSQHLPAADALHAELAMQYGLYILAATAPVYDSQQGARGRPVNRARLFGPQGPCGQQDKQIMTMNEREEMDIQRGAALAPMQTELGPIGVLTCYDVEFPLLGRALIETGAELLLAPSWTEGPSGYWRVRIGAMARALEGQCIVAHSPCLSDDQACPAMGDATGAAGIFGPPDIGFPETGILAIGEMGQPGWVYADIPEGAVARVRAQGRVRNHAHWTEQADPTR